MKFCIGCGKELHDTAINCPQCGAIQQPQLEKSGSYWLSIPALTMGIVSMLSLLDDSEWDKDAYVGVSMFALLAIILAIIGIVKQHKGRGMSIAGLILGAIVLLTLIGKL